jgi:hypothetical protein
MSNNIPRIRTKKGAIWLLEEAGNEIGKIRHLNIYLCLLDSRAAIEEDRKLDAEFFLKYVLEKKDNPKVQEVYWWVTGKDRYGVF